jgi:hypothetical protein
MNSFLQRHSIKLIIGVSIFAFILNALRFYFFPLVSTDSTWTLSSLYDYLKDPSLRTSSYAHEYLGAIFNFNTLHYLLGPIFRVVELNTINFIILHFCIIAITAGIIWLLISNKLVASLIVLFYVLDGYIYGFRSESYNIMLSALMLLSWKFISNQWIKMAISVVVVAFVGFLHPVGAIILGITYLYLLIEKQETRGERKQTHKNKEIIKNILFSISLAVIVLVLFGVDKTENMYTAYLTPSNDTGNHFDGLHLDLLGKYLLLGCIFWVLFFFIFLSKTRNIFFLAYILLIIAFLTVSGRSYYFPYLIIPVLAILQRDNYSNLIGNLFKYMKIFRTVSLTLGVYFMGLTILKFGSAYNARHTGSIYCNILKASKEIVLAESSNLVFLPAELSVECAYQFNQRLIFPYVELNRQQEVPKGTKVLLFRWSQSSWLERNPKVFGSISKWQVDTLIPYVDGLGSLASNFKMQPTPTNKFGLTKYIKIRD